ncbi:DNA polymerase-3 subunit beta [Pullulanibacillus pueri]|uniref:Beta sliding clamp n=1 Tax=Pullulanibacillus pueri TaxID=1437324 RepID=A0A8J2ZVR3_9BACL|nr:DNA polymerase III subunit beta [Pullulanibacillus pueri]MBM7682164.1 DNA polymerase-3 subunit beta [Pullulanibacillus pueri]GGH80282.1 DNA polymerase III subunit beta [Pullulanibacillus pueri]
MEDFIHSESVDSDLQLKVTISREKLVENVNHVIKAVSSRTTIPILTGIKFVASKEGIELTGSDSDVSIQSFIPLEENGIENATVDIPGQIVLQARFFSDIVKKLPGDQVDLEVDSRLMTRITSGSSEFNLNGQDAEEYPHLPSIREENSFNIRTDVLKHVIKQTVFAVSTSETRPVLTGVNWNIQNGKLSCVSTDSHRLAMRTISIETEDNLEKSNVIIPGKSLSDLAKILDDSGSDWVQIIITDNQILFKSNHLQFYSRLLEGNYPNTQGLIPQESKTEVILSTKSFLQAIDRASLLAREERNNVVKLKTLNDNTIEILSQSTEIGRVFENVSTKSIEGEEIRISFSAKYMMDALSKIDATEIKINFTGAMRPFLIRPVDEQDILMLILPVRTN